MIRGNKWPSFKEAKEISFSKIKKYGISNRRDWFLFYKLGKINKEVPSNPNVVYKDSGWVGWYDWLQKDRDTRKYKVNDNYFKKWSSNMAYILGFWFADGHIDSRRNIFVISQHKKRKCLLEKISRELDSSYPIHFASPSTNVLRLSIRSKIIVDDIKKLGGKSNKSLDACFPKVPVKYLPDFIRGLWDGDGTIFYSKRDQSYESHYCSASLKFINELYETLKRSIVLLSGRVKEKSNKKGVYYINFYKNDTVRLKRFIYSNNSDLKVIAKYNKFLDAERLLINSVFLPFGVARRRIKNDILKFDITSKKEWEEYCRTNKKIPAVPHCPQKVYKNKGWIDWYDWLGKSRPNNIITKKS